MDLSGTSPEIARLRKGKIEPPTKGKRGKEVKLDIAGSVLPDDDDLFDLGSPDRRWDNIYATNDTVNTSDECLKSNIRTLDVGLNFVTGMRPIAFNWTDPRHNGQTHYGFSAQELKEQIQGVGLGMEDFGPLVESESGTFGLRKGELIPILVRAIQELAEKNGVIPVSRPAIQDEKRTAELVQPIVHSIESLEKLLTDKINADLCRGMADLIAEMRTGNASVLEKIGHLEVRLDEPEPVPELEAEESAIEMFEWMGVPLLQRITWSVR